MTILDPRLWLAIIVLTVAALFIGMHFGAASSRQEAVAEEAKRTDAALKAKDKADKAVLADERDLRAKDQEAHDLYVKDKDRETAKTNAYINCLHAGRCALRVPVTIRADRDAKQDAAGPAAGGPGREGYAELTSDASHFLVDLLARGDNAIRKHAEVVDRYERLRVKCSANDPPTTTEGAVHD